MSSPETFPRRYARTQRFSLGVPRNIVVSDDGQRVVYLSSTTGDDPVNRLWVLDLADSAPRMVADPTTVDVGATNAELPAAEKARRERLRESAGGIVSYSVDRATRIATFALGGLCMVADLATGDVRHIQTDGPVFGPQISPDGSKIAYVGGNHVRLIELCDPTDDDDTRGSDNADSDNADSDNAGSDNADSDNAGSGADTDRALTEGNEPVAGSSSVDGRGRTPNSETISWGAAEFVAAEEMGRLRGFWWSPASDALLVTRVDVEPVPIWHIGDPNHPEREPSANRYPAAGEANALVSLHLFSALSPDAGAAHQREIEWDRDGFEYLASVSWAGDHQPLLTVQTRDQKTVDVRTIDTATGATSSRQQITDDHWVELIPGTPAWMGTSVVTVEDTDTSRQLCLDGAPITPPGLEVRSVAAVGDDHILVHASVESTELHVVRVDVDPGAYSSIEGRDAASGDTADLSTSNAHTTALTEDPGVHRMAGNSTTQVIVSRTMGADRPSINIATVANETDDCAAKPGTRSLPVRSHDLGIEICAEFLELGPRQLRSTLLLPSAEHDPGGSLPVLADPYGGPHAQRVQRSRAAMAASQWLADQGFAVLVTDGRGTPGRGPSWEREVAGDLATLVLEDQVDALAAAAEHEPRLDLARVAIRGWSFGGYLAALAVLRRPDVFHAAIAGAPVTDWRFYDTHYTERYLGHPATSPDSYEASSLLNEAHKLTRPLMLVHGLADDNVLAIHTLRFSQALLEAGRPHQVLPLSGVTHMTPQEEVAENLLLLQVDFLNRNLARSV